MNEIARHRLFGDKINRISLHDRIITSIGSRDGGVFITLAPCDDSWSSSPIQSVLITHCDWEDSSLDYTQRFAPFHIPIFLGKSIEPHQLMKLLHKGKRLEIIEEYYGNDLHWTLGITPYGFRQHPCLSISFSVSAESEIVYFDTL